MPLIDPTKKPWQYPNQKAETGSTLCLFCGLFYKKKQNRQKYCGSRDEKGTCAWIIRRRHIYRNRSHRKTLSTYKPYKNTEQERLKIKITKRDNYACQKCGLKNENPSFFDMDHKDSNRNHNSMNNLWLLCPNCHRLKTIEDRKNLSGNWSKWKAAQSKALILYQPKPIILYTAEF